MRDETWTSMASIVHTVHTVHPVGSLQRFFRAGGAGLVGVRCFCGAKGDQGSRPADGTYWVGRTVGNILGFSGVWGVGGSIGRVVETGPRVKLAAGFWKPSATTLGKGVWGFGTGDWGEERV
jgi:hypothetical protein